MPFKVWITLFYIFFLEVEQHNTVQKSPHQTQFFQRSWPLLKCVQNVIHHWVINFSLKSFFQLTIALPKMSHSKKVFCLQILIWKIRLIPSSAAISYRIYLKRMMSFHKIKVTIKDKYSIRLIKYWVSEAVWGSQFRHLTQPVHP